MSSSASLLLVDFSATASANVRFSAAYFYSLHQCCPTFLTPRAAHDIIMKPRAAPVNSKVTTNINIFYSCHCRPNLLKSEVVHNVCTAHATFDKFYLSSVTNCHKSRNPSS